MSKQVWFITGASSGFGDAFARFALEQGHSVVATARDRTKLEPLKALAPERVLIDTLDVTQPSDAEAAVLLAIGRFGRIDVLINNAGYGIVGGVEETPELELRAQMETNFFGAVAVTQAILPTMRAQRSGAVVMISSLGGQLSVAGYGAHSASKFALEGLSEALAQEVEPLGIKVLIVEPGAFRTRFAGRALRHMPIMAEYRDIIAGTREYTREMNATQPGDPSKVPAAVAEALASDLTPLRLQLGRDAIDSVRAHAERLLTELQQWEAVGMSTDFVELRQSSPRRDLAIEEVAHQRRDLRTLVLEREVSGIEQVELGVGQIA